MELVNANDKNSFDPTPRLKSSPIPIKFISFNEYDENCIYCGEKYSDVLCSWQKYCKRCLLNYINDITDNDIYLDVCIDTMDLECTEHEISRTKVPQIIQECCGNCLKILCFNQIGGSNSGYSIKNSTLYTKLIESEKDCKLCGKSLCQGTDRKIMEKFKLCSDCYLISSELIESTLVKKQVSILYLPWWYNNRNCDVCGLVLKFTSDCQKYCANCYIFYVGCRYCLTTNISFGPIVQSQCKKCKRISLIINSSIKSDIDDFFFHNVIIDNLDKLKIQINSTNAVKKMKNKYFIRCEILNYIIREKNIIGKIKWIPNSQFTDVKEIAKGGFGTIYEATWKKYEHYSTTVVLKRFKKSEYFLNELNSFQHCIKTDNSRNIIETYGFTKDPELEDYILVMRYASGGDLHKYLQKNFADITWNKGKLDILLLISRGLETIHKKKFIHRDFHSGNILFDQDTKYKNEQWNIGDLGLSQDVKSKSNNEIYGVIPYVAPEIFKGSEFTKEADIYSLGMIMWELTTGCKPFDNVKHDHNLIYKILDGERPKITEDTPECYANLMKSCWDPDPKKRPSIKDICSTFSDWAIRDKNDEIFYKAEAKRNELIQSKKIGPEYAEKRHSEAIYTSRPLSALISECSSTYYSSSTISFDSNYYISAELEFDIDTKSSTTQNCSTSLKKRRNEVLLNDETHDNNGKRVKAISNYP